MYLILHSKETHLTVPEVSCYRPQLGLVLVSCDSVMVVVALLVNIWRLIASHIFGVWSSLANVLVK